MRVAAIAVASLWLSQATAYAQAPPLADPAPRCEYSASDHPAPTRVVMFPDDDLFRPLLADPKEARNAFDYSGARAIESAALPPTVEQPTQVGGISVGGNIGIWARKSSACHGLQISLAGGVFSQFNMRAPSRDLINSDFVIAAQVAMRTGRVSGRIRVSHQSSHLGEDFARHNPPMADPNFGFQTIEGLVSVDSERWRAYGGVGYLWYLNDEGTSALVHAGGDFRARRAIRGRFRPVIGVDLLSLQSRSWGLTTSANGGLEWTSPAATRRMRALIVLTSGYVPFGQVSLTQRSRSLGLQWQVEF